MEGSANPVLKKGPYYLWISSLARPGLPPCQKRTRLPTGHLWETWGRAVCSPMVVGSKLELVWEGHSWVVFLLWLYTHLSTR